MKAAATDAELWLKEVQTLLAGVQGFTLDCPHPLPELQEETLWTLRVLREERDLTYFVHTPVGRIKLGHPEANVRRGSIREVQRAIDLAGQVGARLVTLHPTPCDDREPCPQDEVVHLEREALVEITAYAARQQVAVALENMPPQGVYLPRYSDFSGLFELLEEVEFLGVTLDVGHAHLAGVSLPDVVGRLGRRLWHVHVHDNDGSADQHLPVGQGTVDWASLVRALAQARYQGFLELEFQGREDQMASMQCLEQGATGRIGA